MHSLPDKVVCFIGFLKKYLSQPRRPEGEPRKYSAITKLKRPPYSLDKCKSIASQAINNPTRIHACKHHIHWA